MSARRWLVPSLLLLLAFGLRLNRIADLGTQADEGVHIVVAERLAAGDVLYRDLFENRTPGVEWLLAAAFWLGGGSVLLGRVLAVGAAVVTVAALIAAGRQRDGGASGLVAAALFSLAPLPLFWSRFTMLEHFQTAAAALSIACALRGVGGSKRAWWLAAGLLAGLAFLAKQSGLTLVAVYGAFLSALYLRGDRAAVRRAAPLLAGGFVLAVLPLALLLVVQGAGGGFWTFVLGAQRWGPLAEWPEKVSALLGYAVRRPLVPLGLAGAVVALTSKKPALWLALIWALAEWSALLLPPMLELSWGGFSHYAVPAVAAASLLAGSGLGWAQRVRAGAQELRTPVLLVLMLLAASALATVPGLAADLSYAVRQHEYPLAGFTDEQAVGRAAGLVTPSGQPILVMANSIFYHWSGRRPASRFFHYPSFLPTSSLAAESEAALLDALRASATGAVLVSRMHLEGRLPPAVVGELWDRWAPAASFPYPYQQGVFVFLPRSAPGAGSDPVAEFETGIRLGALRWDLLSEAALLVRLDWSAVPQPAQDYTVFVHLLGPDGVLVTQHDGVPVVGFRPTTAWQAGEVIPDWHWLELPAGLPVGDYELSVGLYHPDTLDRLLLRGELAGADGVIERLRIGP